MLRYFKDLQGWIYSAYFWCFFTLTSIFWILTISIPSGFVISTFTYSKGYSYLLDDPNACVNCHVMQDQYNSWQASVHGKVAVCNDCHTPNNFVGKYLSKAINGWHHGSAFTTGNFNFPIRIKEFNKNITNQSCFKCHDQMTSHINTQDNNCLHCHSQVGHHL